MQLEEDIRAALNRACAENHSNTPDFILAKYLLNCLSAFNEAVSERSAWYDPKIRAGASHNTGSTTP